MREQHARPCDIESVGLGQPSAEALFFLYSIGAAVMAALHQGFKASRWPHKRGQPFAAGEGLGCKHYLRIVSLVSPR